VVPAGKEAVMELRRIKLKRTEKVQAWVAPEANDKVLHFYCEDEGDSFTKGGISVGEWEDTNPDLVDELAESVSRLLFDAYHIGKQAVRDEVKGCLHRLWTI
jgi:hypothetical protein